MSYKKTVIAYKPTEITEPDEVKTWERVKPLVVGKPIACEPFVVMLVKQIVKSKKLDDLNYNSGLTGEEVVHLVDLSNELNRSVMDLVKLLDIDFSKVGGSKTIH